MRSELSRLTLHTIGPVLRGALRLRLPVRSLEEHLLGAAEWIARAQDSAGAGVSSGFRYPRDGTSRAWGPPYPETTGYIIPTFLDAASALNLGDLRSRALRMGEWLLQLQLPEGAFPGGVLGPDPQLVVFNTGQILKGLHRLSGETGQERFRTAATARVGRIAAPGRVVGPRGWDHRRQPAGDAEPPTGQE